MSKSTLRGLIAFILVVVIALGATIAWGIGSRWGEIKNVKEYFNSWGQSKPNSKDDVIDGDNTGNGGTGDYNPGYEVKADGMLIEVGDYAVNPLMSMFVTALNAEGEEIDSETSDSFEITAVITPEDVTDQTASWSGAWDNPSSEWASGKNYEDYVTITPIEGTSKAKITCSQAFGEPIKVTATTVDGTNLSSSCYCNYIKRVTKTDLKISASMQSGDLTDVDTSVGKSQYVQLYPNAGSTGGNSIDITPVLGAGTKEEALTTTVTLRLNSSYYSILATKGYSISEDLRPVVDCKNNQGYLSINFSKTTCTKLFGENYFTDTSYANAVISSLKIGGPCLEFTVTTSGAHGSVTNVYGVWVKTDSMPVKATSITVGPDIDF